MHRLTDAAAAMKKTLSQNVTKKSWKILYRTVKHGEASFNASIRWIPSAKMLEIDEDSHDDVYTIRFKDTTMTPEDETLIKAILNNIMLSDNRENQAAEEHHLIKEIFNLSCQIFGGGSTRKKEKVARGADWQTF